MFKTKEINSSLVTARISTALRMHVGRGRDYSILEFSKQIGVDKRSVEDWRNGVTCPYSFKLVQCMSALPPEFTNYVIEIAGLHGAYEAEGTCDSYTILNKAAELVAKISGD